LYTGDAPPADARTAPRARWIRMTPMSDRRGPDSARESGAVDWIAKPVTASALRMLLAKGPAAAPADAGSPALAGPALGAHVLLAEDNAVNAEIASEMLRGFGCTCVRAADGEEVLAHYRREAFDLVLMDCQMPLIDGFEAARQIRHMEGRGDPQGRGSRRTPIIALTANAMRGDRERCLAAGMDDHLGKPFRQAELRVMLQRWLVPVPARGAGRDLPSLTAAADERGIDTTLLLENLQSNGAGARELVVRILALFLAEAPAGLEALERGLAAGDASTTVAGLHGIKAAAAAVGAHALYEMLDALEAPARTGAFEAVARGLVDLRPALAHATRLLLDLQQRIAQAAPGDAARSARHHPLAI
jgi:CheY-like chemotaxis protein